jgi:hypothetical protein
MKMKKTAALIIAASLIFTMAGCGTGSGSSSSSAGQSAAASQSSSSSAAKKTSSKKNSKKKSASSKSSEAKSSSSSAASSSSAGKSTAHYCTISITCHELVDHKDKLSSDLAARVPSNGVIMPSEKVKLKSGDTVYKVLLRITRKKGIQTDSDGSTSYGTAYVRAIDNFYEKDAGDQSGWMYSVNGAFPNKGCSKYKVTAGDKIEWQYTLKLGNDLD